MKVLKYSLIILINISLLSTVKSRGKTYDDLDDILRHEGLNSTSTHIAYKEPLD